MKAYTWDELAQLWEQWAKEGFRQYDCNNQIEEWLKGFPEEVRPVAALAMSAAKWRPGSEVRRGRPMVRLYYSTTSCACCAQFDDCEDCPLDRGVHGCAYLDDESEAGNNATYNLILSKYREAYERLPREWREQ